MLRIFILTAVVVSSRAALAQVWFGPTMGAGSTAAGSAMTGMANAISASGSYNLATSQAAINMTQAQSQEIQNQAQATQTYFEMREMNQAYQAAERGPRATPEQLERLARNGAPRPISTEQIDPVSGRVDWPVLLQDNTFATDRGQIEKLLGKQATYGGLGLSDQTQARQTINSMFKQIKTQIRDVPPQVYSTSRTFLESLMFSMTKTRLG